MQTLDRQNSISKYNYKLDQSTETRLNYIYDWRKIKRFCTTKYDFNS